MLNIVLVSVKDWFTRPLKTQNKFFSLTNIILNCFYLKNYIIWTPLLIMFHYVPVPNFHPLEGCEGHDLSCPHTPHSSLWKKLTRHITVLTSWRHVFQLLIACRGSKCNLCLSSHCAQKAVAASRKKISLLDQWYMIQAIIKDKCQALMFFKYENNFILKHWTAFTNPPILLIHYI